MSLPDERHNAENTLREVPGNREELSDLNEKTFLSMISHEFRSPLSTIMITADTVEAYLERMSSAEVRGKMALIRNNTLFLDVLMQKVLNLVLLDSGNLDYLPAETDFNEFVSIVIAEIQERQDLNHVIDFRETKQPVFIRIDIEMMKLSLKNLIFNALKYSPEGSTVTIDLSVINSDLTVQITDHGIGIPEEDAARIYDVFYRGSNVRHIRGTGLGLCLVRKCVVCHGGRLSFVSREHVGTTFTMTLPGVEREARSFFKEN